jgi:hypothetical protein
MASSAFLIQTADATPRPPTPQFTVRQIDSSYEINPKNITHPFTGEAIPSQGRYVKQFTIEVIIKNQWAPPPATVGLNTTGLHYNVQLKQSNEEWSSRYSDDYNKYGVLPQLLSILLFLLPLGIQ